MFTDFIRVEGIWRKEGKERELEIDLVIPVGSITEVFWIEGEPSGVLCYRMCDGKEETIYLDRREFERVKSILIEEPEKINREDWMNKLVESIG